jgi:hypothetical protein
MRKQFAVVFNGHYAEKSYTTRREAENRAGEWMAYLLDTPYGLQGKEGSIWDNLPARQHVIPRVVVDSPPGKRPIWCMKCWKFVQRSRWARHYEINHGGCVHCHSPRLKELPGDTYDRDGIRNARKCLRCGTEMKAFAHGYQEKTRDEYVGELPTRLVKAAAREFHAEALKRGYTKRK